MRFCYPKGICFACSKCAICCGDNGNKERHILLLKSDVNRISAFAGKGIETFALPLSNDGPYKFEMLKNHPRGSCVFLAGNHCSIYNLRPLICRFYPFELIQEQGSYNFRATDECPAVCKADETREGTIKPLDKFYFKSLLNLACTEFNRVS